ncbi:MAG: glycoside hydrolase family 5 protein [Chloroflexi bacterium]|nr:MAG: glycoside hydrolase family 5 protein [Chloroflexota bacterium]
MFQSLRIRTLSLLLMMALLASVLALPTDVVHAINTPWLNVSGRFIKDPAGNNVVLRGVSLVDVAVANSRPRNAVALTNMVTNEADGWYARVVRFPVYPNEIDETPGWLASPDTYFNNHLDPAIQNCVARQIYCIIDWHYIQDYNNSTVDTATRAFWNYVAPKYANVPNVIFELYNEPVNPDNWFTWKQWAQPWVNIIRSHAPNNLILIGGPRWSQNLSSAASAPFTGSNLVYVAHIYPQHGGQSTWDSWFGNAANSVPFFVTEWGWQQGGTTPTSGTLSGYGIPFSNYLESKGLSWTAWVFDQWWQPVMFDLNYNLLGGENYMGQYTKDFLFQHRNDNLPGGGGTSTPTQTNTPTNTPVTVTPTFTPITPTQPGSNNTGWVSPSNQASQSGGDGNGFQTSPTNAFADGGGEATDTNSGTGTSTSCTSTAKDRHAYFSYPLSIPAGSSITGIEVRTDARADSASGTRRFCVELSWNNGANWTAMKTGTNLATTERSDIFGSASDTWGRTWNTNELTSANLRVRIVSVGSSTSRDFFLDWLPVRVWYSGGGVTNTPTFTPTGVTNTPTFTPTGVTLTPTFTPTQSTACSPVSAIITAPFQFDGAGSFCWQISSLSYINSWNLANLTVNGVNFTNLYAPAGSLPARINGNWYISYTGNFPWSHFEAK